VPPPFDKVTVIQDLTPPRSVGRGAEAALGPTFRRRRRLHDDGEDRRRVDRAVARAKANDRDALQFLYTTYAPNIYGYVCSLLHDEHEAEDVTQQVFLKLMTVIDRYEQRSMSFSAWLLRVAHNTAIDHLRARRAVPCEEVRGADDQVAHDALDCRRSLRDALAELPDEQREVLVLRHLVGLSPGEIADQMGKTEHAVHGLHHRGRRTARRRLTTLGSAPRTLAATG
jgi:RNA polymerase sigma-70 factor (ECF subfamily)